MLGPQPEHNILKVMGGGGGVNELSLAIDYMWKKRRRQNRLFGVRKRTRMN
jgi:hypothetical protein